ncbi:MAG: galK [Gemmatimonadetes bacterium]|nr:galK [Gemmatimonadota bacterium]
MPSDKRMKPVSARDFFIDTFGSAPHHIASAPARVNLIGEHTDYNGGEVLPIGIDHRTHVAVRARTDRDVSRVASSTHESVGSFDAREPARSGQWWDYVAGVVREISASDARVPQLDIAVTSDVPAGAGLSSSAAIAVATALAIGDLLALGMSAQHAAEVAWRAETGFVGVPCGIMDQFASALAHDGSALHVWCDTMRTEHVRCDEHVLIFDTGVSRGLRQSAFATRRDECARALVAIQRHHPEVAQLAHASMAAVNESGLEGVLRKRATHVVEENARVKQAVGALAESGTIPGELLVASHASLRDLYECSSPELDWFVENALEFPGVRGARLTGAGWGGCAIATGEAEALSAAAGPLAASYAEQFPHSARTWVVRPAVGARIEE